MTLPIPAWTSPPLLILLYYSMYAISRSGFTDLFRVCSKITSQESAGFAIAIILLPGTFVHELSHYLAAKALLLTVTGFRLIPKQSETGILLGEVTYVRAGRIRGLIVGIAPFFGGAIIMFMLGHALIRADSFTQSAILLYLTYAVSATLFSSKQDLKDAWVLIPLFVLGAIGIFLFPDWEVKNITNIFGPHVKVSIEYTMHSLIVIGLVANGLHAGLALVFGSVSRMMRLK